MVSLDEMKNYLRVDFPDDDSLITFLIGSAKQFCMDVLRVNDESELENNNNIKVAVMYTTAYLYEHREEADHHALMVMLRALLFGSRKEVF